MNKWQSAAAVLAVLCLVAMYLMELTPSLPFQYAISTRLITNCSDCLTTAIPSRPSTATTVQETHTGSKPTTPFRLRVRTGRPANVTVCAEQIRQYAPPLQLDYENVGDGRRFFANHLHATGTSGGIGNQLFELVSTYGIARTLNRQPMILGVRKDVFEKVLRLSQVFPRFASQFDTKHVPESELKKVNFAKKCCVYESEDKLKFNDTFLFTTQSYLQSYKFFHRYVNDIRKLLAFTPSDLARAECEVVKSDDVLNTQFRLCVHVRRGDFVKSRLHEHPREDFTAAAIKYVIEKNVPDRSTPSSVIMIGNDHDWSHSLLETINITSLKYVTETKPEDGHVDLAFATLFCDSVLLPASASSFGWWMAYISRPGTIVYYNAKYSKPDGIEKEFEPKDFFLPEWIALRYDNMTNTISEIKW